MDEAVKSKSVCRLTFSQIAARVTYTKKVLEKEGKLKAGKEALYNWFQQVTSSGTEAPQPFQ